MYKYVSIHLLNIIYIYIHTIIFNIITGISLSVVLHFYFVNVAQILFSVVKYVIVTQRKYSFYYETWVAFSSYYIIIKSSAAVVLNNIQGKYTFGYIVMVVLKFYLCDSWICYNDIVNYSQLKVKTCYWIR